MPSGLITRLRANLFVFPLAAAIALAMILISEASYQRATRSLDAQGAHVTARATIQSLWRNLAEAESAQRGYLLSGRDAYLQTYQQSVGGVRKALDALHRQYQTNRAGANLVDQISQLSSEKLSEMETTLHLYHQGPSDAWRELILTNIGKEKMDGVRTLSDRLMMIESEDVARERDSVFETLMLNRVGITAMVALSLLALFMYLRKSSALQRQHARQHELIQAERDRLEVEVTARTAELKELAQHLQTIREDERSHLARELHDDLGALLTAAKLDAARLKLRLGTAAPEVADRLAHLNEALNSGIALKRRIIEDLRPSSLSNLGLVAALEILLREFGTRAGIEMRCELQPVRLTPPSELTVYRVVQEALTNIAKYARATCVHVALDAKDGKVRLSVRDNGVGFDADQPQSSTHGLLGMRYRIDAVGGEMTLRTAPGEGTVIEAWLPEAAVATPPTHRHSGELLPSST